MNPATPDIHELAKLAKLVRRIDDRQQLTELISRYGMAVDDRDFDTIGRLFAEDGEFHGFKGRQTIVDYYRARTATFGASYHYAHTWHFDLESEDSASGAGNAHAELCIAGKTVRIALRYIDRYRRSAPGWQFQSRTLKFRYVLPFDEVANGLADPMQVRWPGTQPQMADLPDKLEISIASRKANTPGAAPPAAR